MATDEILNLLIAERGKLDAAIRALSDGGIETHGKTAKAKNTTAQAGRVKRVISDAARARMAKAQQARWAKVRRTAKKTSEK